MEKNISNKKNIIMIVLLSLFVTTIAFFDNLNKYENSSIKSDYVDLLYDNKIPFYQIEKYIIYDDDVINKELTNIEEKDISNIKKITNMVGYPIYKMRTSNDVFIGIFESLNIYSEYGMKKDAYSYPTDDIEIVSLNELNDVLDVGYIGNFPSSSNEIMISNYLADFIISRGIKVYNNDELSDYYHFKDYDDIISGNKYIGLNDKKVKISGIINYDLSKYEILKNKTWDLLNESETKVGDDFVTNSKNIFCKIFVNDKYFKDYLNISDEKKSYVQTGILYRIDKKEDISDVISRLDSYSSLFFKSSYSEEYYNSIMLVSTLKNFTLYTIALLFIMIVALIFIYRRIKEKNNYMFYIISLLFTYVLYSILIYFFGNILNIGYLDSINPFTYNLRQYVLITIIVFILSFAYKKIKQKL